MSKIHPDIKTSSSHPINVSWIIPPELLIRKDIQYTPFKDLLEHITEIDENEMKARNIHEKRRHSEDGTNALRREVESRGVTNVSGALPLANGIATKNVQDKEKEKKLGNICLSSCPGKKVRLDTGIVRGRLPINRDLNQDFARISGLGVSTVVCCLNDAELAFLGARWENYNEYAKQNKLEVLRLPIIEGSCPDKIEDLHSLVQQIDQRISKGENVLVHCRGGIGRAGLVACCWLLYSKQMFDAVRVIRLMRRRRSPKAIETIIQEDFIAKYAEYVSHKKEVEFRKN
ncbi:protein-tyrosine phosphatase-like protein [Paraphysoderma sedebokerense]|nr:protein-tyrosine phosphatase-like protein [Paraphysoderma sedebokerense]